MYRKRKVLNIYGSTIAQDMLYDDSRQTSNMRGGVEKREVGVRSRRKGHGSSSRLPELWHF